MPSRRYEITVMVPVTYEVEAVDEMHACSAALHRARGQFPDVALPDQGGTTFRPFALGGWAHPPRRKQEE